MTGMRKDERGLPRRCVVFAYLFCAWGCASFDSSSMHEPARLMFEDRVVDESSPGKAVGLAETIRVALTATPKLQMLEADVGRMYADFKKSRMPASPQLQFGLGQSRERDSGSSVQETDRRSSQSGLRESRETSVKTSAAGAMTGSETSSETATSRSDSRSHEWASAESGSLQDADGYRLGVRLYPPNPWAMSASVSAAYAARAMSEAGLLREQHAIVCDIVASTVRIDVYSRMLHVQTSFTERCEVIRKKAGIAVREGTISGDDFSDVHRIYSSAVADSRRISSRLTAFRREFAVLTGVDPSGVALSGIAEKTTCPLEFPEDADALARVLESLAQIRPDVLVAFWNMRKCESEAREAGATLIPWFTHIGASFSRSYSSEASWQTTTSTAEGNDFGSRQWSGGSSTYDGASSLQGSSTSTGSSEEWGNARSSATRNELGRETSNGSEWWVETGVNIPVFEWFSGETKERRNLARTAQLNLDRTLGWVKEDIRVARQQIKEARITLAAARAQYSEEEPEMRRMAGTTATQGLTGEANALRIEQGVVQMLLFVMEQGMEVALAELNLCRVAGLIPGKNGELTGLVRSDLPQNLLQAREAAQRKRAP